MTAMCVTITHDGTCLLFRADIGIVSGRTEAEAFSRLETRIALKDAQDCLDAERRTRK